MVLMIIMYVFRKGSKMLYFPRMENPNYAIHCKAIIKKKKKTINQYFIEFLFVQLFPKKRSCSFKMGSSILTQYK